MKKIKSKIILILILALCIANILISNVNADMGPKPSITINLKNMPTNNYLIDLLVYDATGENYNSLMGYGGDSKKISFRQLKTLYKINYDGWISESTRWNAYFLFADCVGNSKHEHYFGYIGTPYKYKVLIINNDTGEIKLSDEIIREDFTSNITLDYQTMNIAPKGSINIVEMTIALIITVTAEMVIALIMKLKNNIKLIIITNIVTNIILQTLLIIIPPVGSYIIRFIIMEIVVIVSEYLIYKKYIKEQSTKKILSYTLIANLVTALLTFFII